MVKADSTSIHSLAELKDSRVAGMKGSKQIDQVKVATGLSNVTGYDITYLLFQALVQDKEQVIVQDEPSAQQVVLMRQGNDELTAKVNKGIATVQANGELQKIEQKWFGK